MSTRRVVLVVAVVVVAAGGFAGWWFLIRDDAPPRASVEAAGAGSGSCDSSLTVDDIQGTWTVDTSGSSVAEGTGTFAGYRIGEELASIGTQDAVGRTGNVTGEVTVDGEEVGEASFEVDMTTLQSDESRRDGRLRSAGLETDRFPTAAFTLTEPLDLGSAQPCEENQFTAVGDLELHGVTRPVEVGLDASFDGEQILLAGSAPVVLADFDIEKPVGLSVLSIEDQGEFELQIVLTQGSGGTASGGGSTGSDGSDGSTETTETTETTDGGGYEY